MRPPWRRALLAPKGGAAAARGNCAGWSGVRAPSLAPAADERMAVNGVPDAARHGWASPLHSTV